MSPLAQAKANDVMYDELLDYSLVGANAELAVERGLADADWYQSPVPREQMRALLERKDGPAIRDTLIWFGLMALFGSLGVVWALQGSLLAIPAFLLYGVLYGSSSDSRWHESSHGTAFKTDGLNNVLYEISSFMVMRESTVWRWSHTRHHSDTIIVGRDPEIAIPRPPDLKAALISFTGWPSLKSYFTKVILHAQGKMNPEEETYIPDSDYAKIFFKARIYLSIYAVVISLCFVFGNILPLLLVGLPNLYGAWLMPVYGNTQHAGLAENVLDHRMNCRTVYMNVVNRYLYWNMNYHVEHHMFPLVPYHNLPKLHELVKDDMPTPYPNLLTAWKEMIPAVRRQVKDPGYFVQRKLPTPTVPAGANVAAKLVESKGAADAEGWIELGPTSLLEKEDVLRFDHAEKTYAVYRGADENIYATDGICTHGNTHLATGLVIGCQIECPKHNGRFDVRDGSPQRSPVCVALKTYPIKIENDQIFLNVEKAGGEGASVEDKTYRFKVKQNHNVATYIKELVLEPLADSPALDYKAGQYLQMNIPAYGEIGFNQLEIKEPFASVWRANHVYDYKAENHSEVRRNFSLASRPGEDGTLKFNIRVSTPPRGQDCNAGIGSTYMWSLKPGDEISAVGPFGDFAIKETDNEMVYLGGGAGMAPLRSHVSNLFENLKTGRKVSYWYGARSKQEIFYQDYFEKLAADHENFDFHIALSEPLESDAWASHTGYIHEVLWNDYLKEHANPEAIEYYLCGPQPMIQAARTLLKEQNVPLENVSFDEF